MLRDLSLLVSPILVLLLSMLMPISVDTGAHSGQLFDPVFPHVHPNAQLPTAPAGRELEAPVDPTTATPAVGAGAGASATTLGGGLTAPLPNWLKSIQYDQLSWELSALKNSPDSRPADPPPDPPPTAI